MGDYEDRYPDAFGRGEETDPPPRRRRFFSFGLPRQVRDGKPAIAVLRDDAPRVVNIEEPLFSDAARDPAAERLPPRDVERTRRPLVERTPREICDDVWEQLNDSPFIDASGISVTVENTEVRLDGTINSLIAISLARALVSTVPGVSRVQVQLRVQRAGNPAPPAAGDEVVSKG